MVRQLALLGLCIVTGCVCAYQGADRYGYGDEVDTYYAGDGGGGQEGGAHGGYGSGEAGGWYGGYGDGGGAGEEGGVYSVDGAYDGYAPSGYGGGYYPGGGGGGGGYYAGGCGGGGGYYAGGGGGGEGGGYDAGGGDQSEGGGTFYAGGEGLDGGGYSGASDAYSGFEAGAGTGMGEAYGVGRAEVAKTTEAGVEEEIFANLPASSIVTVDESNWNAVVEGGRGEEGASADGGAEAGGSGAVVLVLFYFADSTAYLAMREDFNDAAELLEGEAVLAELNVTENASMKDRYGIEWSPTLKLFVDGDYVVDYKGPRTRSSMYWFVSHAREPALVTISSLDELDAFREKTQGFSRVYGFELSRKRLKRFQRMALDMRSQFTDSCAFAVLTDERIVKKAALLREDQPLPYIEDREDNGILFVHTTETLPGTSPVVYFNPEGPLGMGDFITLNIVPLIGPMGKNTAIMYKQVNLPVAVAFHERESAMFGTLEASFLNLAKRLRGSMLFAYGDPFDNGPALDNLFPGIDHDTPRVAILWLASENPPEQFKPRTDVADSEAWLKELEEWIAGYYRRLDPNKVSEDVKPRRSEPIPPIDAEDSTSGILRKVVAKSWDAVVEDKDRDVVLVVHVPDDDDGGVPGPGTLLLNQFRRLEPHVRDVKTLRIAEFNAKLNSLPQRYDSPFFPVVRMFPAGPSPKEAVSYSKKNGTLAALLEWIVEESTFPLSVDWDDVPQESAEAAPMPMTILTAEEFERQEQEARRAPLRPNQDAVEAADAGEEDTTDQFFTDE